MNKIIKFFPLALIGWFGSCSEANEPYFEGATAQESDGVHVCSLVLDVSKPSYEGESRSGDAQWANGDKVYIMFSKADKTALWGNATYSSKDDNWTLTYTGNLPDIEEGECSVYYFDGETHLDDQGMLVLSMTTCTYSGWGSYSKSSTDIKAGGYMNPASGRIRFEGQPDQNFIVAGLEYCSKLDFDKSSFQYQFNHGYETCINQEGTTEYLYLEKPFSKDERTLSIIYDRFTFTIDCVSPILDIGQSGYMQLPTKESHQGWDMIETTSPVVGATTVTNIQGTSATLAASIISDGNSNITEHGFVYSKTQNPTFADNKVLCQDLPDFQHNLTGLLYNTTYYVRAYATNEFGTSYGSEVSFTTKFMDVNILIENVTNVTYNSAVIPVKILELGGHTLTEVGICWGRTPMPDLSGYVVKASSITDKYEIELTNLLDDTKYYVRAYAKTLEGEDFYSNQIEFYTEAKSVAFDKGDYNEDSNWDSQGIGIVNKEEYGEDENWN